MNQPNELSQKCDIHDLIRLSYNYTQKENTKYDINVILRNTDLGHA